MLPLLVSLLLAAVFPGAVHAGSDPPGRFADVTQEAGLGGVRLVSGGASKDYILETIGTGVAAFDFDLDGLIDLYLANGSRLEGFPPGQEPLPRLFRNRGDGTFEDVSAGSGLSEHFWGFGTAVGDYDNDGWPDLFVTAYGADRLYRNLGGGTFAEVGRVAGLDDTRWGASAAFADFDADGLLDLYVANYVAFDTRTVPRRGDPDRPCLYRGVKVMCGPQGLTGEVDFLYHNNGDGTFTDVTAAAGIRSDLGMFGLGVATGDYDDDGDEDIYVANDATPNQLYRNRGDGTFDEVGSLAGVAYGTDGVEQGSMGTAFGDYDGDGRLDIVVTNFSHQFYQLLRNTGKDYFEDVSFESGIAEITYLPLGWAAGFLDVDLDGWLDLFLANGHVYPAVDEMGIGVSYNQTNQLLLNVPAGTPGVRAAAPSAAGRAFLDVSALAGPGFTTARSYRAGGPFDFDRDGDLDLVMTVIDEGVVLLRNETVRKGRWISFRLAGTASNRSALGARLTVTAGGRRMVRHAGAGSYLWGCEARPHFGLGAAATADRVEVRWPSGARQTFERLPAGREYLLVEGRAEAVPAGGAGR